MWRAYLLPPPLRGARGVYFAVNARSDQEPSNHGWTTHAECDLKAWLTETFRALAVPDPSRLRLDLGALSVEAATDRIRAHTPPPSVLRHLRSTKLEVYVSGYEKWSQVNAQFVDAHSDAEWADRTERRLQLALGMASQASPLSQLEGLTAAMVCEHLWPTYYGQLAKSDV